MKKIKIALLLCTVLAASAAFIACEKPPTAEMEAAAETVTRAENDADAIAYAGSALARAREALARMQAEADSKKYDAAKSFAAEAVSAAEKAIADGKTGAARVREEAAGMVNSIRTSLPETEQAVNAARDVKNIQLDFNAIDQDFETARRAADQAELSLAKADYQDTLEKCRTARGILSDITEKVAGAATAVSRKK